jgi:hypothetical protein
MDDEVDENNRKSDEEVDENKRKSIDSWMMRWMKIKGSQ